MAYQSANNKKGQGIKSKVGYYILGGRPLIRRKEKARSMKITRRGFLKLSGATAMGAALTKLGISLTGCQKYAANPELRIRNAKEVPTICAFCGAGCGQLVAVENGKVINVEGDPDHPINQGALCSKANAFYQVATSPQRLTKVLYRAPGVNHWEEKDWDWAISQIARKIKTTRDENWIEKEDGTLVNRTEAIGHLGGSALDNEECYLLSKALRSLGLVYVENQPRI